MIFKIGKLLTRLFFFLFYRVKSFGLENFIQGPAIVAPNHNSFFDPLLVQKLAPELLHQFARQSLNKNKFIKYVLNAVGCHPIIQKNKGNSASFKYAFQLFSENKKLVLYPEGTRSYDGELQQGQLGIAMLTVQAQVPIIPVYIQGTFEAFNRFHTFPRLFKPITCVFGKPLFLDDILNNPDYSKKESYKLVLERVMNKLHELKIWCSKGCKGEIP